jgi:hypothetical protein
MPAPGKPVGEAGAAAAAGRRSLNSEARHRSDWGSLLVKLVAIAEGARLASGRLSPCSLSAG